MTAYYEYPSGHVYPTEFPTETDTALGDGVKRLTRKNGKNRYKAQSAKSLHRLLSPGDTVHTVLRHVSRSGALRRIDLYAIIDNEPCYLSGYAAALMGERVHKDGGIVVAGGGMDMGFHLVYGLGRAMWPVGTQSPHGIRNGEPDSDGGFALKHRWI